MISLIGIVRISQSVETEREISGGQGLGERGSGKGSDLLTGMGFLPGVMRNSELDTGGCRATYEYSKNH